jgi:uncharacterized protein
VRLAMERKAFNVRIFGSVAKGTARADSDVDFLVDTQPGCSGFDLGGLYSDLEAFLGRRIDLVTPGGVHWFIRDDVIREAIPV